MLRSKTEINNQFAKKIKQKIVQENINLENSLNEISSAINNGNSSQKNKAKQKNSNSASVQAVVDVLAFFNLKPVAVPNKIKKIKNKIKFLLNTNNIATRRINLEPDWFKNGTGAILAQNKIDKTLTALIPSKTLGQYYYTDFQTKKKIKINRKRAAMFDQTAILLYEPLPATTISFKTLISYLKKDISIFDILILLATSIVLTFLGLITPKMVQLIFSTVVKLENVKILSLIGVFLLTSTISEHFFKIIKSLISQKIVFKLILKLEAALVFRTISMPISFFKTLNSGEIFARISTLKSYCKNLVEQALQTWLACALSIAYFFQIFSYAKALVVPAIGSSVAFLVFGAIIAATRTKIGFNKMNFKSKETATTLEIITGIEKIKLTGSEKPAFTLWAKQFAESLKIENNPPLMLKIQKIVLTAIKLIGNLIVCVAAAIFEIEPANFFAFSLAFSALNSMFFNLANTTIELAKIKPLAKFLKPIFQTLPEQTTNKKAAFCLHGLIEVDNLSFSYDKNGPSILEKVSFKIKPKQTVAIFGKSGCGKSTLIRLLIGFEKPTSGSIFFENNDINSVNLKLLRKKIGIVTENGKLFNGNIFLNIAAKNKNLSLKQAWRAAKIAHIDQDIAKLPMKMNTLIIQEGGEFSKAQVQRILIARAVATKPKILILDGFDSELDFETQKLILNELKALSCTTIIATSSFKLTNFCDEVVDLNKY